VFARRRVVGPTKSHPSARRAGKPKRFAARGRPQGNRLGGQTWASMLKCRDDAQPQGLHPVVVLSQRRFAVRQVPTNSESDDWSRMRLHCCLAVDAAGAAFPTSPRPEIGAGGTLLHPASLGSVRLGYVRLGSVNLGGDEASSHAARLKIVGQRMRQLFQRCRITSKKRDHDREVAAHQK
jgi:hypothetical protein